MAPSEDEDEGEAPINLRESRAFTIDEIKDSKATRILAFNAQSMNNKFQKIRDITQKVKPTVLAIQETWGKNESTDYSIRGYHKPEIRTRKGNMNAGGGVGLWVLANIDYEVIESPFVEKLIETQTIILPDLNICIINVYRPFGEKDLFTNKLVDHISKVRDAEPTADIIVVGDFNIDLLQDNNSRDKLIESTVQLEFIQQVTLPTRVTETTKSLIDHCNDLRF